MPERTVTCPNGCNPAALEREPWDLLRGTDDRKATHGTEYFCTECQWQAVWNDADGLMVKFAGAGRD